MPEISFHDFQNCYCFNLRWVSRVVTQHYDHALSGCGLRVTQLPILARLAAEDMTMADLADWLAMDRTTLLRNLRPLERADLVYSVPTGEGRKLKLVLSQEGAALLEKAYPVWRAAQQSLTRILGQQRWETLINDLAMTGENLTGGSN